MFKYCKNSKSFFKKYLEVLNQTAQKIDLDDLDQILEILKSNIKKRSNIFVAGNGGAASVANHLLCDFNKGIKISSKKKLLPKVISLVNSIEHLTATSNDIKFSETFSSLLENYGEKKDCLILFSCSGTSKNIINAIKIAKNKKIKTVLISGFCSKKNKNVNLHLDLKCKNYGITEDLFSSIMHMLSQYIRFQYDKNNTL